MNLLVDIGNSRLKWGMEQSGLILRGDAIDYHQVNVIGELQRVWRGLAPPGKLAIASVAAKQVLSQVSELACSLWPALQLVVPRTTANAFGVSNAYRQPEKLGVDRWLAMLAAHHYYPGRCCVVDCGTAITVDVVDADGRHLGGLITPGLRSMKKALAADTVDLTFIHQQHPSARLADNTVAAIDNGTLLAAVGLIEAVLHRQDMACRLILSGGDAEAVAGQLQHTVITDPELVLKGLSIYCNHGKAE
ncbi:MAG: type III pantothenate kinase [Methylococcaceae bacterium]|nr:type III pantothenate kinase [Methylococcaceae bacterium]